MASPDSQMRTIVVSDLHIGDGERLEDFLHDSAFADFVRRYVAGSKTELVLNGDTIDFLQVQPLGAVTLAAVPYKLDRVFSTHPEAFQSLADHTSAGGVLTIIEGNHDIEMFFPGVQEEFLRQLAKKGGERSQVRFLTRWTSPTGNAVIEHGHQADRLNRFRYDDPFLDSAVGAIQLPWGSHFVLRVFNYVEPHHRMIDKIRPEKAATIILLLVDRDLFLRSVVPFLGLNVESWLEELRMLSVVRGGAHAKGPGQNSEATEFAADLEEISDDLELIELAGLSSAKARASKGFVTDQCIRRIVLFWERQYKRSLACPGAYDFNAARILGRETGASFVIFGHTHHACLFELQPGLTYLNSGTWTRLLDIPEGRDSSKWLDELQNVEQYPTSNLPTFVEIETAGDHVQAQLKAWDPVRRDVSKVP